jgi:hypothetical protein
MMFSTKPGFVSFEKGAMFNFELQQKHGGNSCDGEFAKCYSADGFLPIKKGRRVASSLIPRWFSSFALLSFFCQQHPDFQRLGPVAASSLPPPCGLGG